MVFGIAFLFLGITAVVLQAWLWGPRFWNAAAKKSLAPRAWTNVHRSVGFLYVGIYVLMMWHMVPRLWQYQFELPARTVIHAVVAIVIGVLLATKLAILRWFRHFEEAMPRLGFGLLLCTVVLTMLSVPYALRAHDLGRKTADPENVSRVREVLSRLDLSSDVDELTSEHAFRRGRRVLVRECATCHDMRTILSRPRTGSGWLRVVERMMEKPAIFGESLESDDIPFVTSYLIAITPDLQRSTKRRREEDRASDERAAALRAPSSPSAAPAGETAEELLATRCTECHDVDEIDDHGGDTLEGWTEIVMRMITEEEAELSAAEARLVAEYLSVNRPPE